MKVVTCSPSPNFSPTPIDVRFLVLHYTATTLARTLEIFHDPARQASAHLVIDEEGGIHEVVPCLHEPALRAWHAGRSVLDVADTALGETVQVTGLNDFAIGVELVNLNGNVFEYTDKQYSALAEILDELKKRYPALADPQSVVGHEHIAGFRGKCDPGNRFDWQRFFRGAYDTGVQDGPVWPSRHYLWSPALCQALEEVFRALGVVQDAVTKRVSVPEHLHPQVFEAISGLMERTSERT